MVKNFIYLILGFVVAIIGNLLAAYVQQDWLGNFFSPLRVFSMITAVMILLLILAWLESEPSEPNMFEKIIHSRTFQVFTILLTGITFGLLLPWSQNSNQSIASLEQVDLRDWDTIINRQGNFEDISSKLIKSNIGGEGFEKIRVENIELRSERSPNGYSNSVRRFDFIWRNPIHDRPLSGILSEVYIEPGPGYEHNKYFCRYIVEYQLDNGQIGKYYSSDYFVPKNAWQTLMWDFTGYLDIGDDSPYKADWENIKYIADTDGHYFLSITRRLGENMLYSYAGEINHDESVDWRDDLRSIRVSCGVSANERYTESTASTFFGNIYLGNVWVETVSSIE